MSSSTDSSTGSTSISCEERIDELIRKIKEISSGTANSTASSPEKKEPEKTKVESSPHSNHLPQELLNPSSSPKPRTPPPLPASPIDPSATHKRSVSPPPKALKGTFPCPPVISLPNESKISPPAKVEDLHMTSKVTVKLPLPEEKRSSTDVPCVDSSSTIEISPNSPRRGESSTETSDRRRRGRSRRPRGTLYTLPELVSQRPTRTSNTMVSNRPSTFPKLTLLTPKEPEIEKATSKDRVPEWLTKLPEVEPFRMESALEHGVMHSEDLRLEDPFQRPEYAQLHWETVKRMALEVDWHGLGFLWWDYAHYGTIDLINNHQSRL